MKKKLIFVGGALLVALSAMFFTQKPLTEQEKLILRNVEAIARNENTGSGPFKRLVPSGQTCKIFLLKPGEQLVDGSTEYILGNHYTCIDATISEGGYIDCQSKCVEKQ